MSDSENPQPDAGKPSRMSRFGFKKPRIFPPVWFLMAFLAMFALNRWLPVLKPYDPMTSWSSWLALAPGLVITLIAAGGFKRAKTGMVPFSKSTHLMTTGIYRFTRNPMYLGMVLVLAGAALKLGSLGAWIPIPLFAWVIQHQFIRNEEIFLSGIYGDEYRAYLTKVRRWL